MYVMLQDEHAVAAKRSLEVYAYMSVYTHTRPSLVVCFICLLQCCCLAGFGVCGA